jgi:hypothetical protein
LKPTGKTVPLKREFFYPVAAKKNLTAAFLHLLRLSEDAKVMGVATLQSERAQNLNFAIPVQIVNAALAGTDENRPASPLAGSATD